jgi:hypothetical protein
MRLTQGHKMGAMTFSTVTLNIMTLSVMTMTLDAYAEFGDADCDLY